MGVNIPCNILSHHEILLNLTHGACKRHKTLHALSLTLGFRRCFCSSFSRKKPSLPLPSIVLQLSNKQRSSLGETCGEIVFQIRKETTQISTSVAAPFLLSFFLDVFSLYMRCNSMHNWSIQPLVDCVSDNLLLL